MNRLVAYLKATRGELEHVSWPSRRQAVIFTVLVVAVSLLAAAFLGVFDYIFADLVDRIIIYLTTRS